MLASILDFLSQSATSVTVREGERKKSCIQCVTSPVTAMTGFGSGSNWKLEIPSGSSYGSLGVKYLGHLLLSLVP